MSDLYCRKHNHILFDSNDTCPHCVTSDRIPLAAPPRFKSVTTWEKFLNETLAQIEDAYRIHSVTVIEAPEPRTATSARLLVLMERETP